MTKLAITQSEKRFQESLGQNFSNTYSNHSDYLFLCSSTDIGVERNFGRNGARFAPRSILAHFKKLTKNQFYQDKTFSTTEVANEKLELADFKLAQKTEAQMIAKAISSSEAEIIHLGGGHDHIYPLLSALAENYQKIVVLNVDAHADTRIDEINHSGTPFRQFASEFKGEFHLFQYGIQEFANSLSTLSDISPAKEYFLTIDEIHQIDKRNHFMQKLVNTLDEQTAFVFSLDVDALDGSIAPGVSAVNGQGLSYEDLLNLYQETSKNYHGRRYLGIYELNPVYDTLSMKTARLMTNFIFRILQK